MPNRARRLRLLLLGWPGLLVFLGSLHTVGLTSGERPNPEGISTEYSLLFLRDGAVWGITERGQERKLISNAGSPVWSPTGQQIAFVQDRSVRIKRLAPGAKSRRVFNMRGFSKDLALAGRQDPTYAVTLTWHPVLPTLTVAYPQDYQVKARGKSANWSSSPNGTVSLSSIYNVSLKAGPGQVNSDVWLTPLMRGWRNWGLLSVTHPSWSPDGRRLAFVRAGSLCVASVDSEPLDLGARFWWNDWSESEVTNQTPVSGSSYPEMMGAAANSWHPSKPIIAYEVARWIGNLGGFIHFAYLSAQGESSTKFIMLGGHPRFSADGRFLVYESRCSRNLPRARCIFVLDTVTYVTKEVVHEGSWPEPNPDPDRGDMGKLLEWRAGI